MDEPRLTLQALKVLALLAEQPSERHYGLAIASRTGLAAGTTYPILARFEQAGWVTSDWEATDPAAEGRPRRRYYRLTPPGERQARRALAQARRLLTPRSPQPRPRQAPA
jgi:PadR family transcriptional regulator